MTALVALSRVVKDFHGLRPLRLERLEIVRGEQVALLGVDRPAAEVLINLITGATLPDRGSVRIFDRSTADILDGADWLTLVDRIGIFSERAVLMEGLSAVQNLAIPFSLEIEPPAPDVRRRASALAREVGLGENSWDARIADLDAMARARVRLGRSLALDPEVLLLEHPAAAVPARLARPFGAEIRAVVDRRGMASLALGADRAFAEAVARKVLMLDPATGRVAERPSGWLARLAGRTP